MVGDALEKINERNINISVRLYEETHLLEINGIMHATLN